MPSGSSSFDAWIGALSGSSTFDAVLLKTRSGSSTFDANVVKAGWSQFDALIVDTRGSFRGTMTTDERNALDVIQPGDTVITTDAAAGKSSHEYTPDGGTTWLTGARTQAANESGRTNLVIAPTTGTWRVEIGDPTFPIRYWDGTSTRFSVNASGDVTSKSITLTQKTTGSAAIVIDATGSASNAHVLSLLDQTGTERLYIDRVGSINTSGQWFKLFTALTDAWPEIMLQPDVGGGGLPGIGLGPGGATPPDVYLFRSGAQALAVDQTLGWGTSGSNQGTLHKDGYVQLSEMSAPSTPGSNLVRLYAKDRGGESRTFVKSDAGSERMFNQADTVAGPLTADVTVANTATDTAILSYTVPANTLAVGSTYRFVLAGTMDNIATSGTWIWAVKWGTTTIDNITIASQASAHTDVPFWIEAVFTVRSIGASGTAHAAIFQRNSASSSATSDISNPVVTIDTTASTALRFMHKWSTADAGNSFDAYMGYIELIKP